MSDAFMERLDAALTDRYRIVRELGEGGMATVYLAEDLKHERNVALKVLRPELAAVIGAERFLAEIKTTANLQHPHILPLFDSGEADGFLYYVMPFIDGESLRDRLDREQQLGVDEAVRIARDVGDALDYAHRNDVIHRDIKPANILLHDGRPVVADFGIALAVSAAGGGRMTETGLSLGTPHYMSPEQASADRDLSARSDIYSLGCVLYEMLAGQPPHTGPSAQNILVRILTETPRELTALRHTVPPHVSSVVMKAIEKLPADRFETARQFVEALRDEGFRYSAVAPAAGLGAARTPSDAATTGPASSRSALVAALVLAALATVLAAVGWLRSPAQEPVRRLVMVLDSSRMDIGPGTVLSPDGSRVVYTGVGGGLWLRDLRTLEASPIPLTDGARTPFFSPDGERVGFHRGATGTEGEFVSISLVGGPPVQLARGDLYPGGAWSDDGHIYFADEPGTLLRVPQEGGALEVVADSTSGHRFAWPEALPGAAGIVAGTFDGGAEGERVGLVAVRPSTGEVVQLLEEIAGPQRPAMARYAGGYLFWITASRTLMAAEFDVDGLALDGEPLAIASDITAAGEYSGDFDVSGDGTLLYSQSEVGVVGLGESMSWVSRSGAVTPVDERLGRDVGDFDFLRASRDGRYIAAQVQSSTADGDDELQTWIYDLDQSTFVRLTLEGMVNVQARWADDRTVAYISVDDDEERIVIRSIDGGGEEVVFRSNRTIFDYAISPTDGSMAVSLSGDADGTSELVRVTGAGEGEAIPFLTTAFEEGGADISPDGRWVAYVSTESGRPEVYVRAWPGGGSRAAISVSGGSAPRWSPSGEELFYVGPDDVIAAELDVGDRVSVVSRSPLFPRLPFEVPGPMATYDVVDGGDRLLMISESSGRSIDRRILVLNIFEELKERAGR